MKIEILPCHRNERSREIALRLRNLIALLPSPRTVRGNFQGRKLLNNGQKPRDELEKGLGYSALNTARSALSCIIQSKNIVSFGSQPLASYIDMSRLGILKLCYNFLLIYILHPS